MPIDFSNPQSAFEALAKPTQLKPLRQNWIILYQGQPMKLATNHKQRWNRPSHALSALTNAFEVTLCMNYGYSLSQVPYKQRQDWLAAFKEWRSRNIQIVRQEDYDCNAETSSKSYQYDE